MSRGFAGIQCACAVVITVIFLCVASCNRSSSSWNGILCVNRVQPKAGDYKVTAAEQDSILTLFSVNNLSTANLQFLYWTTDSTTNVDSNQYNLYQEQVTATAYVNGLPVLAGNVFFSFNVGRFQPGSSYQGYTGPAPAADTSGHQVMAGLRSAFLAHVSEASMSGGPSNSKPLIPSASTYINSCLSVTLGYLDASVIPGSGMAVNKALVKVWVVTPSPNPSLSYYPSIYVEDDNGLAWGRPIFVP